MEYFRKTTYSNNIFNNFHYVCLFKKRNGNLLEKCMISKVFFGKNHSVLKKKKIACNSIKICFKYYAIDSIEYSHGDIKWHFPFARPLGKLKHFRVKAG